jgi:hypothetical protein
VELQALSTCVVNYLLLIILTGLSRCENVSWASFHLPFSLIYTSVTIKGLVTSCFHNRTILTGYNREDDCPLTVQ